MLLFHGVNTANVVYVLNEKLRDDNYQGNNRMPFRRLYTFYETESAITQEARDELRLDSKESFIHFLKRASWVFELDTDDTHVTSKKPLAPLQYGRPLEEASWREVVSIFKQMHRHDEKEEDGQLDVDDLDEVYSGTGSLPSTRRRSKRNQNQTGFAERASQAANPFMAKKKAQPGEGANGEPTSRDDNNATASAGAPVSGDSTPPPDDPDNLEKEPPKLGQNPFMKWR